MSLRTQVESNGIRPNHPEGDVHNSTGLDMTDYWGDISTEHQALQVRFFNVQIFPNNVLHHRNGSIIKLINDRHIN